MTYDCAMIISFSLFFPPRSLLHRLPVCAHNAHRKTFTAPRPDLRGVRFPYVPAYGLNAITTTALPVSPRRVNAVRTAAIIVISAAALASRYDDNNNNNIPSSGENRKTTTRGHSDNGDGRVFPSLSLSVFSPLPPHPSETFAAGPFLSGVICSEPRDPGPGNPIKYSRHGNPSSGETRRFFIEP